MVDYQQYALEEEMLEYAEDYILGKLAAKRDKKAKPTDFIDIRKW